MTSIPSPGHGRFTFEPNRSRKLDPCTVECGNCGATVDEAGAYRCQGASPDLCLTVVCEDCRQACYSCGLTACVEHFVDLSGEKHCHRCVALMNEEAEAELKEMEEVA